MRNYFSDPSFSIAIFKTFSSFLRLKFPEYNEPWKFLFRISLFFFNNAILQKKLIAKTLIIFLQNSIEYLKSNCFIIEFSFGNLIYLILYFLDSLQTISYMKGIR